MSKLTEILKYASAPKHEQRRILNKESFKSNFTKGEIRKLTMDEVSETGLVQEVVHETAVKGAESRKVMRDVLPVVNVDSHKLRATFGSDASSAAPKIAEGSKHILENEYYTSSNIDIKKFGTRPVITNELVDDQMFDLIELEIKKAGARIENALNKEAISVLLENHSGTPSDITPAGPHIASVDVLGARSKIVDQGYGQNFSVITHPVSGSQYLYDEPAFSGVFGNDKKIWGMKPYELSLNTYDSNITKWDDTVSANHYYGLVLDNESYGMIAMRRDITIEQYDDPIHDLVGIVCSARFGVGVQNSDAACRILTK